VDMAHYAGLVSAQVLSSPFTHADVVTCTTHKSLRGPRAGLIFSRRALEDRINFAVFPSLQGGPHNNVVAAIACQLKEVSTPQFRLYAAQVKRNAAALATALMSKGYKLATDGTDTHLVLWDLRPLALTGSKMEALCDAVHITLNKNAVHGDVSALVPGGVRIGTPALTTRGLTENDFITVAEFLHRAVQLAIQTQSRTGKELVAFKAALKGDAAIQKLATDVKTFSSQFFMPGLDPCNITETNTATTNTTGRE